MVLWSYGIMWSLLVNNEFELLSESFREFSRRSFAKAGPNLAGLHPDVVPLYLGRDGVDGFGCCLHAQSN